MNPKDTYFDAGIAARFARLALDCVTREYPNKIAHTLTSDADVAPPRRLTPAFYGCFDWHSAVHGHWLLARLSRMFPHAPFTSEALAALERNITAENIDGETRYLRAEGRNGFERPYGLAWLLQLSAELRYANRELAQILRPLEEAAAERFEEWLPKLPHPVRSGEHSNTAFALGLAFDWSLAAGNHDFQALIRARSHRFYAADRGCPLAWEPSGEDFLSPCLAEADLMRRVLPPAEFAEWLTRFMPDFSSLRPAVSPDPSDGKLAHLDGLNLSRGWMLEAIARALPEEDMRRPVLAAYATVHSEAGLAAVTGRHYEGGHWLGTFAVYLL